MYCNNCGNANAEGKFCDVCGAELTSEPIVVETQNVVGAENIVETIPAVDPGKTLGTVSLILGIAGIVLGAICPCLFACLGAIVPMILSIIGLILGIVAMNKSKAAGFKNKAALIGVILSGAAIGVTILCNIIGSALGVAMMESYY